MGFGARLRLRHETDTARLCINELLKVSSDDVISWPIRKRRSYCFISTSKIQLLRFCSLRCHANLSRDLSILSFWHLVHFNSKFGLFLLFHTLEMLAVIVVALWALYSLFLSSFIFRLFSILSDRFSFITGPFHTYQWSRMSKTTESVISPCTRMWILRKYVLLQMTSNWFGKWTISYYNNSYYTLHALNILIRKFGSWTCGGNTETSEYCFWLLPIPRNCRIGQKTASFELVVINRSLYRVTQYWWYNLKEVIAHAK